MPVIVRKKGLEFVCKRFPDIPTARHDQHPPQKSCSGLTPARQALPAGCMFGCHLLTRQAKMGVQSYLISTESVVVLRNLCWVLRRMCQIERARTTQRHAISKLHHTTKQSAWFFLSSRPLFAGRSQNEAKTGITGIYPRDSLCCTVPALNSIG